MFIHSNKKYTERSMYLVDPYRYFTGAIPASPILYWPLQGDLLDKSGNNNHATGAYNDFRNTTDINGITKYGMYLDGKNIFTTSNLPVQTKYTLSFWIESEVGNYYPVIGSDVLGGTNMRGWSGECFCMHGALNNQIYFGKNASQRTNVAGSFISYKWNHMTFTNDGTTLRCYIDKVLIGSVIFSFVSLTNIYLQIGNSVFTTIRHLAVYDRVLTSQEIDMMYKL